MVKYFASLQISSAAVTSQSAIPKRAQKINKMVSTCQEFYPVYLLTHPEEGGRFFIFLFACVQTF